MHNNRLYEQAAFYLKKSEELQEELEISEEIIDNLMEFVSFIMEDSEFDDVQAENLILEMYGKSKDKTKKKVHHKFKEAKERTAHKKGKNKDSDDE